MKVILDLLLSFMKIGAFTLGGGYAMLPLLQKEVVEKHGWLTEDELTDYFAIGQCTPGVIAVNVATFTGYKTKRFWGSVASTIGVVLPSFFIIIIIAAFITNFSDIAFVQNAFAGIRVCVCVLILNTIIKLFKNSVKDYATVIIYLIVLATSLFTGIQTVFLVVGAGIAGIIINLLHKGGSK